MSERERWIVYPLLFFALGAAVRDKLFQRVQAKEIHCESLKVIDPRDSNRVLAQLGSKSDPQILSGQPLAFLQVGEVLCDGMSIVDRDSNRVLAQLGTRSNPQILSGQPLAFLHVSEILCDGVSIVDGENSSNVMIRMSTAPVPSPNPDLPVNRVGTIVLRGDDAEQGQVSELRADQFISGRVVTNQVFVVDPVNRYPRLIAMTQPVHGVDADGSVSVLNYEGVLYLNNRAITSRPISPTNSQPVQPGESSRPE